MQSILFGRTLKGIIEGDSVPSVFIPRLIALHRQGKFPLEQIVTRHAFEDINKAVRETESGLTVKAICVCDMQTPISWVFAMVRSASIH
jgi:aryl-alcohol dehydrogenase